MTEKHEFMRQFFRYMPRSLDQSMIIKHLEYHRDPHDIMEELRQEDPDAHALLSEHLVLPEKTCE